MIIIKTTNGDYFINDKEVEEVIHDRAKQTAHIHRPHTGFVPINPPIEHVESIIYINDQTGKEWKDEGSELEELKAKYDENLKWGDNLRGEYMKVVEERNHLEEEVMRLQVKLRDYGCEL